MNTLEKVLMAVGVLVSFVLMIAYAIMGQSLWVVIFAIAGFLFVAGLLRDAPGWGLVALGVILISSCMWVVFMTNTIRLPQIQAGGQNVQVQPVAGGGSGDIGEPGEDIDEGVTGCRVIHDYNLDVSMLEVATEGTQIHVEYFFTGNPEYETVLDGPGRYPFAHTPDGGHVWEYQDCSLEQVMAQVMAHIGRRIDQDANNGGFVPWTETGLWGN